jgi:hypothetical protein
VSPAYLHPEFGLLCPSRSFRRKARLALAFLALLVIVGALALKAGHDPDIDGALITMRGDEARSNAETVQTVGQATSMTAERSRALEGSNNKAACEGDPWSYIDGKCSVGKARRLGGPRAANEGATIAALPLGRSTLPASSAALLDATGAANIAVPTPAVADPPAPAPKKVRKASRSQNSGHDLWRDWNWRDDQRSARAYVLPDDRYLRGRHERWGWSW